MTPAVSRRLLRLRWVMAWAAVSKAVYKAWLLRLKVNRNEWACYHHHRKVRCRLAQTVGQWEVNLTSSNHPLAYFHHRMQM